MQYIKSKAIPTVMLFFDAVAVRDEMGVQDVVKLWDKTGNLG